MKEIKGITLTYIEIAFLANSLAGLMLHSQELRSRNVIVNLLNERLREWETARMDLVKKYAEEKGGEPVVKDGQYAIREKSRAKFDKEFRELVELKYVFDVLPSNENDWRTARGLLTKAEEKGLNYADGKVAIEIAEKLKDV